MTHHTVLAGGTGASKFLRGLVEILPQERIHIIVNVGDDAEIWGLHISPDIDTILYALSGQLDVDRGWGLRDDSFRCLETMERFGMPSWFRLGDADLAMHITRTALLRSGLSLSEATLQLAGFLRVRAPIFPATDGRLRTRIGTPEGILSFQEFFVRERWQPEVRRVEYDGAQDTVPAPDVVECIREADSIVVAPSNPITSIGPILAIPGIRDALRSTGAPVIAISPIVGRAAVSGPAGKLMEASGCEVSPAGIAHFYQDFLDEIVVDDSDVPAMAARIRNDGIRVRAADIMISTVEKARRLAEQVCAVVDSADSAD